MSTFRTDGGTPQASGSSGEEIALRRGSRASHGLHPLIWLLPLALLVLGAGYGTFDPAPPDSPRFASIARDMLVSGQWLFPRVGGDLYADKPPLYFWLMAGAIWLTGSVRGGFLLPSLLASISTLLLLFDLSRRLFDRETAVVTSLALLSSVQFALQAHTAQIDGTLCFFSTLGLYGLLRHLLDGPDWGWYALGGLACGLGVITKGVGFLPLLVLLPFLVLRTTGAVAGPRGNIARWSLAPLATVTVVGLWLVPMVLASLHEPALAAYRDEILFGQTVDRYVHAAGGHSKPVWYFFSNVIPWAWLPLVLAVPWLVPRWIEATRQRDARVLLPLAWVVIVLVFFTLSRGKRGVYILPALPALCLAAGPYLRELLGRRGPHLLGGGVLALLAAVCAFAAYRAGALSPADVGVPDASTLVGLQWAVSALALLALASLLLPLGRRRLGLARLGGFLMSTWLVVGGVVAPLIDEARTGVHVLAAARAALPAGAELGITHPKESFLLASEGTLVNFGHRRPDGEQESADAARWLHGHADRRLIVPQGAMAPCFDPAQSLDLGYAHRATWYLVPPEAADAACAARGDAGAAIAYRVPARLPTLWSSSE